MTSSSCHVVADIDRLVLAGSTQKLLERGLVGVVDDRREVAGGGLGVFAVSDETMFSASSSKVQLPFYLGKAIPVPWRNAWV